MSILDPLFLQKRPAHTFGIYLHIPFCKKACHYCNFYFSTSLALRKELLHAMVDEIKIRKEEIALFPTINTIYIGGGTPSLLEGEEVALLLALLEKDIHRRQAIEITLEGNPNDLKADKIRQYVALGIHRLSIGVQSFHQGTLHYLNRSHDAQEARESILVAQKEGIVNINVDLIYAIPNHSDGRFEQDLEETIAMGVPHLSLYALTIEPKTVFAYWQAQQKMTPLDEHLVEKEYLYAVERLEKAGYVQYEVSNFCLPDFFSRHNINYWTKGSYIGIGPSAHSFYQGKRRWNIAHNRRYIESIAKRMPYFEEEILTQKNHYNETIMLGLRTSLGCHLPSIMKDYGIDIMVIYKHDIEMLLQEKLARIEADRLILTARGKFLADQIALTFMR